MEFHKEFPKEFDKVALNRPVSKTDASGIGDTV